MQNNDNPGRYNSNSEPAEYTHVLEEEKKENYYLSKHKTHSHRWGIKAALNVLDE